jgi:hypothetical protein
MAIKGCAEPCSWRAKNLAKDFSDETFILDGELKLKFFSLKVGRTSAVLPKREVGNNRRNVIVHSRETKISCTRS